MSPGRGVKTGQPSSFWPGPFLARFKWVGPSWPDKAKQVAFLGPARGLAGLRTARHPFPDMFILWPKIIF